MQISVFSNDGRFPVQFEFGGQSQIYRFRQDDKLKSMADVQAMLDDTFISGVLAQFQEMQALQSGLLDRSLPAADDFSDLPIII